MIEGLRGASTSATPDWSRDPPSADEHKNDMIAKRERETERETERERERERERGARQRR